MTGVDQTPEPYFYPHIPDAFDGTLVIADSHYRGKNGGISGWGAGFDRMLNGNERKWTIAQIRDCTSPGRTEQLYHILKDVLRPQLTVPECFNHLAFVNAFPGVLPEIGAPLPLAGIKDAFRANLAAVKPDRILVVSKRVWNALPTPDERLYVDEGGEVRRYGNAWATWCYHPTGKFSRHHFRKDRQHLARRLSAVLQRTRPSDGGSGR